MARRKAKLYDTEEITNKPKLTARQVAEKDKTKQVELLYEKTKKALQQVNLTKTENRTFETFSKERLRTFMKNPKSNEDKLRSLSQFLYRFSQPYRRLIQYYAQMIDPSMYTVIPKIQNLMSSELDENSVLTDVYNTCSAIRALNLRNQLLKFLIIAWREDTAYGYIYADETGSYIMPLDGNYCKISSIDTENNTYNFAFDFTYFRSHSDFLEYWDKEFKRKYDAYTSDTSMRWQELDPERTFCIKVNSDDTTLSTPPFLAMFEQIIDLIDTQSIQKVKNELSIYKLLIFAMKTRQSAQSADQFTVDTETVADYYNRILPLLPPEVSAILSPVDIETIEFKDNATEDVDMVATSMHNLFANAGSSQILDSSKISGSMAFETSMMVDSAQGLCLLPQIECWVNAYLTNSIHEHGFVKFIRESIYTRKNRVTQIQTAAQYGVPVKMEWGALLGYDPIDLIASQQLESALHLAEKWIPVQSSATMSSQGIKGLGSDVDPTQGGAPTKDASELSEAGDKTRQYKG